MALRKNQTKRFPKVISKAKVGRPRMTLKLRKVLSSVRISPINMKKVKKKYGSLQKYLNAKLFQEFENISLKDF